MDNQLPLDPICSLPLSTELFALSLHPRHSVVALGLSNGRVEVVQLPNSLDGSGMGTINTVWSTRRHKFSCRTLAYSIDGSTLFSGGGDGIIKVADGNSGQVVSKTMLRNDTMDSSKLSELNPEASTVLRPLDPLNLLVATDSGALCVFDLRVPEANVLEASRLVSTRPKKCIYPHDSWHIASISPLRPTEASTSGFSKQWISTGGDSFVVNDLRKGILSSQEVLDLDLLSSVVLPGNNVAEDRLVVGPGSGRSLLVWNRGKWDEEPERVLISMVDDDTIDSLAVVPEGLAGFPPGDDIIAAGLGSGHVVFAQVRRNKCGVLTSVTHTESEEVIGIGFDVYGRMVTGGGNLFRVWHERLEEADDNTEESRKQKVSHKLRRENVFGKPIEKINHKGKADAKEISMKKSMPNLYERNDMTTRQIPSAYNLNMSECDSDVEGEEDASEVESEGYGPEMMEIVAPEYYGEIDDWSNDDQLDKETLKENNNRMKSILSHTDMSAPNYLNNQGKREENKHENPCPAEGRIRNMVMNKTGYRELSYTSVTARQGRNLPSGGEQLQFDGLD